MTENEKIFINALRKGLYVLANIFVVIGMIYSKNYLIGKSQQINNGTVLFVVAAFICLGICVCITLYGTFCGGVVKEELEQKIFE